MLNNPTRICQEIYENAGTGMAKDLSTTLVDRLHRQVHLLFHELYDLSRRDARPVRLDDHSASQTRIPSRSPSEAMRLMAEHRVAPDRRRPVEDHPQASLLLRQDEILRRSCILLGSGNSSFDCNPHMQGSACRRFDSRDFK